MEWGFILIFTYKSPFSAPCSPLSPAFGNLINCPSEMPGRISRAISRSPLTLPPPLHSAQTLFGICPSPLHCEHKLKREKFPKNVLRFSLISPCPPHTAHCSKPASGLCPKLLHFSQFTKVWYRNFLTLPLWASSSVISCVISIF